MERAFADYASEVLDRLDAPLPPLEHDTGRQPLDEWMDLPPLDTIEWSDAPDGIDGFDLRGEDWRREQQPVLDGAIVDRGLDALAFYKSIRFRNRPPFIGKWGIFIFDFSVYYLSGELEDFYPGRWSNTERNRIAFECIRDHEIYHFRVDVWALGIESAAKKALYESYLNRVYMPFYPSLVVVEESLANAFALKRAQRAGYSAWLRDFMRSQPGAYAAFDRPNSEMRAQLAAQITYGREAILLGGGWEHSGFIGSGRQSIIGDAACPTHRVPSVRPSRVIPSSLMLPNLSEVRNEFIPNYLSGVPAKRTDHQFVRIDNGEQIKVPNPHGYDRLRPNEYKNILHKAGLMPKDFRKAREQTHVWKLNCPRNPAKPPITSEG